ncbi:hypothetical protein GCM10020000_53930 [Streptomyces olivoverticillatus]
MTTALTMVQAGGVLLARPVVLARLVAGGGQVGDGLGGPQDGLVGGLARGRALGQGAGQQLVRGGHGGGRCLVGAGRGGHAVADDRDDGRAAVRGLDGGRGERVLVAVVAQAAVADRGDACRLVLHVIPFARLCMPAVFAVPVFVDHARPAGPAASAGPRAGGLLCGHPGGGGGAMRPVLPRSGCRHAPAGPASPGASGTADRSAPQPPQKLSAGSRGSWQAGHAVGCGGSCDIDHTHVLGR